MTAIVAAAIAVAPTPRASILHAAPPAAADDSRQNNLEGLRHTLEDPAAPAPAREEAARRLVARGSSEARQVLISTLEDVGNRSGQLAVAKALSGNVAPDLMFINPLFALLGKDKVLTEAAAQALAQYKNNAEVFNRLRDFATARQQVEAIRISIIKAIGTLYDKRAASLLIELLTRDDENASLRNAAADALIDMTGLNENARDVQLWRKWWADNANKPDNQWEVDLLRNRAARYDSLRKAHNSLIQDMQAILADQYKAAPDAQRGDILLRYLRSGEPQVRIVGAQIITDDSLNNRDIPAAVRARLRELVGDSDTQVRQQVAITLRAINDPESLDALLSQFLQEPDAAVRRVLAGALGHTRNIKAIPPLLKLLDDPSFATASAGADALQELGAIARDADMKLALQVSDGLKNAYDRAIGKPGGDSLRLACLEAMAPLRDSRQLQFFSKQLTDPDAQIRRASLRALGELGKVQSADTILNSLGDPDVGVRAEAVNALGSTATFAHADGLYAHLKQEREASIRERIWRVLETLYPSATKEQLFAWADRPGFKSEPQRRVTILKALAAKLLADKEMEPLATTRQNIGEMLMKIDPPDAAEAATYFGMALEYWRDQKVETAVTETLVAQRMEALLKSKQYAAAAAFAAQMIEWSNTHQQTMGSQITNETERLRDAGKPQDVQDALSLINEAQKMRPPLDARYDESLKRIKEELMRRTP